jgi:membrane protease YdiL (CAAX protease family)
MPAWFHFIQIISFSSAFICGKKSMPPASPVNRSEKFPGDRMNSITPGKLKRNVILYCLGVLLLSTFGGVLSLKVNPGLMLLFAVSPLVMMLVLRFFAGDGWGDAGLRLKFRGSWPWYLFAFFVYPFTILFVLALGGVYGITTLNGDLKSLLPLFLTGLAAQFLPRMLFALFEEWGWRGYLEPRLAALNVPDLPRHLLVGVVWAAWHVPMILTTNYTSLPYWVFFPLFLIGVLLSAVVYGQLRKASGTVWTAVLMHGTANTVAWAILQNNLVSIDNKLLANISPESVFSILLWAVLAWWMLFRRKS